MRDSERRSSNGAIGLGVVAGMLALAAATAAYILLTTNFRRSVDTVQPDAPSLRGQFLTVAGLTVVAVAVSVAVWRLLRRNRNR